MIYVIFIQHASKGERCVNKTRFGNGKRPITLEGMQPSGDYSLSRRRTINRQIDRSGTRASE